MGMNMNWIKLENITEEHKRTKNLMFWQENLSDKQGSRFQRGSYIDDGGKGDSFIQLYPRGQKFFDQSEDWKNYDLEGDMCQITHYAVVEPPK